MATPTIEPRSILYQSITDQIIRELEHSTVPWHKPWSCGTLDGRILHPSILGRTLSRHQHCLALDDRNIFGFHLALLDDVPAGA